MWLCTSVSLSVKLNVYMNGKWLFNWIGDATHADVQNNTNVTNCWNNFCMHYSYTKLIIKRLKKFKFGWKSNNRNYIVYFTLYFTFCLTIKTTLAICVHCQLTVGTDDKPRLCLGFPVIHCLFRTPKFICRFCDWLLSSVDSRKRLKHETDCGELFRINIYKTKDSFVTECQTKM